VIVTSPPAPPTTYAPPRVVVSFASDGSGRLVVPRQGTVSFTVSNQGGLASQYLVSASGVSLGGGAVQGTLQPGQSVSLSVGPPPGDLSRTEKTGTISVLGAINSSIPFVIPAA
jgi:hypothetical protein